MKRYSFGIILLIILNLSYVFAQSPLPELTVDTASIKAARGMEAKAITTKDSALLGKAYFLFGDTYKKAGNFTQGREYFLKAIQVLKTRNDSYELGMSYLMLNEGMNINFQSRQDYQNACEALDIFSRMGHRSAIALAYNYLTSFYKRIWVWNEDELRQTINIPARRDTLFQCISAIAFHAKLARDTSMMAEAHLQRADLFRHFNDKRAIEEFNKAQHLQESRSDVNAVLHTLCHKAAAFMKFHNMRLAVANAERAERMLSMMKAKDYWTESHVAETCRDVYEAAGMWERAFRSADYLNGLYAFRRSGDRDNLIESFHVKVESEKKEAELLAQKAELEKARIQRQLTWVTVALFILAVITTLIFFVLYKKNKVISAKNQDLVREQNHRVKNNLQVISSLLSLQAQQVEDLPAKQMIDESLLRIESMAVLHRRLYDGKKLAQVDLSEFIPEIIYGVFQTLGVSTVRLECHIASILLGADKATPVGLIINELATNACKYAFPYTSLPEFRIECRETQQGVELKVSDNGPGMPAVNLSADTLKTLLQTHTDTFGVALIQSQVIQLYGKGHYIASSNDGRGTTFMMTFKR
jgi:two-component sensor histidine kinase